MKIIFIFIDFLSQIFPLFAIDYGQRKNLLNVTTQRQQGA